MGADIVGTAEVLGEWPMSIEVNTLVKKESSKQEKKIASYIKEIADALEIPRKWTIRFYKLPAPLPEAAASNDCSVSENTIVVMVNPYEWLSSLVAAHELAHAAIALLGIEGVFNEERLADFLARMALEQLDLPENLAKEE